jgi:hypothetical protein
MEETFQDIIMAFAFAVTILDLLPRFQPRAFEIYLL